MATWHYFKAGYALPMNFVGHAVLSKTVDMPAIIASGVAGKSPLAQSEVRTAVLSTGMPAVDVLQLWRVPAGTFLRSVGLKVVTANALATTVSVGCVSITETHLLAGATGAMFMALTLINTVDHVAITEVTADGAGSTDVEGCVYIIDGTIDLTLAAQTWLAGVVTFWADVCKVF